MAGLMRATSVEKAKERWWSRVDRTQTVEVDLTPPAPKPTLEDHVETMRLIRNKIVNHECDIARLKGQMQDQKEAMFAMLQALNVELQFFPPGDE